MSADIFSGIAYTDQFGNLLDKFIVDDKEGKLPNNISIPFDSVAALDRVQIKIHFIVDRD